MCPLGELPVDNLDDILKAADKQIGITRIRSKAHYQVGLRLHRLNWWLGVPTIILSAVVGSVIFASLKNQPAVGWQILTGLVAVAAAVLASLQTFLNYGDQARMNDDAAAGYSELRRHLLTFKLHHGSRDPAREPALTEWDVIMTNWDDVQKLAPHIPNRTWDVAAKWVREEQSRERVDGSDRSAPSD